MFGLLISLYCCLHVVLVASISSHLCIEDIWKGFSFGNIVEDLLNRIMMKVVSEINVLAKTLGFLDWFFPNGAFNRDEE